MPVPTESDPRTAVAAAASPRIAAALRGPVRAAEVVSAGEHAVYVRDGATCLAVLGRAAVAVPCGLRTRLAMLPRVGSVTLGDGRLIVGPYEVTVGRLVDVRIPVLACLDPSTCPTGPALDAVRAELPAEALDLLTDADAAAVPALLGRGSGLTPVGDDVLAGWLVTCHATGADGRTVAAAVSGLAPTRTTTVSAALLDHATAGECIPQLRTLLLALQAGTDGASALDDLLTVGHTSGAGLALGVALAAHHPSVRRLPR